MAFDLDKVIAEREAHADPFTFTFDGHEYTLPPDIDTSALDQIVEGNLGEGMRRIAGDEQWQRIVDSPKVLGAIALSDLFEAYMTHVGADSLGELQASTRSSRSTARPSKQTSRASTLATKTNSGSSAIR